MNTIRHSTLAAVLVLALPSFAAFAQTGAAPPAALPDLGSASAAAPARTASAPVGPRVRSAAETGNRAAVPGDLHPERPVAPQISIPFGKKAAPPTKGEDRVVRRGNAATTGGVDEVAARCESQTDEQLRAACRAKQAREAKGKLPN
ncbi:MAG: hypothetical protein ABI781_09815 [Burkholderiales bacterium]